MEEMTLAEIVSEQVSSKLILKEEDIQDIVNKAVVERYGHISIQGLIDAAENFVDKCDRGAAYSVESYGQFKEALGRE